MDINPINLNLIIPGLFLLDIGLFSNLQQSFRIKAFKFFHTIMIENLLLVENYYINLEKFGDLIKLSLTYQ